MVTQSVEIGDGEYVTTSVINPRLIKIIPLDVSAEVRDEEGNLIGLNYADKFKVDVGGTLPVRRQKYMPLSMKRVEKKDNFEFGKGYYIYNTILTKSSIFILPFLGKSRSQFKWKDGFMNCFIGKEDEGYDDHIYLWYRYEPSVEMDQFETFLMTHANYVSHEDVDKYHVLYKFEVPDEFKRDYRLIKSGKFSKISEVGKQRLLKFNKSGESSPLSKILYKHPDRKKKLEKDLGVVLDRDAELHGIFDEEKEIYLDSYSNHNSDAIKPNRDKDVFIN